VIGPYPQSHKRLFEAKEIILKGAGKEFDPGVVRAFSIAVRHARWKFLNVVV